VLLNLLQAQLVQYAFGGMFVTDPMAQVLKLFALLATGFALVYAQSYARAGRCGAENCSRSRCFTLLGVMTMISANKPAGDLPRAGAAIAGLCMRWSRCSATSREPGKRR